MRKKGYLDMSFSWIFALIIGAMILFGAIYGVVKFSNVAELRESATSATELGTIFDSLESSSEDASSVEISFSSLVKIKNNCDSSDNFGYQGIEIEKFIKNKWTKSGFNVEWENKYIFSDNSVTSNKFYAFTKPFYFPYKVANVIYLIPYEKKYCFLDTPIEIKKELTNLNQQNFYLSECPADSVKVCFKDRTACDIKVNQNTGEVLKNSTLFKFQGDELMYAAIFSDNRTYECTTLRLMKRANLLSELYRQKGIIIRDKCESTVLADLTQFSNSLSEYKDSKDISSLYYLRDKLDSNNKYARCKLW